MAWKTGFLRLWLLLSALWCAAWLLTNNTVQKARDFAASHYLNADMTAGDVRLERIAGGIATVTIPPDERNAWIGDGWWMDSPRVLEIDTSGVSPDMPDDWNRLLKAAALAFNKDAELHNAKIRQQRTEVMQEVAIAVGLPLLLLALGAGVGWVLAGFRTGPK